MFVMLYPVNIDPIDANDPSILYRLVFPILARAHRRSNSKTTRIRTAIKEEPRKLAQYLRGNMLQIYE
jgi:hypothetical protein